MDNEPGKIRRLAIRIVFLLTAIALLPSTFQALFLSEAPPEPFYGIALSFWLALSALSLLGLLYPIKMLPLLILQMLYKGFWLLGVGLPLWSENNLSPYEDLFFANAFGIFIDIAVIPWIYLFKKHITKPTW